MNISRLFKRGNSKMVVDDLIGFVYNKDFKKIESSIKNKSEIDIRDEDGRTLLMHAVLDAEHDLNMIHHLIKLGIDVNACDNQNWTALHFACQDQKTEIANILIENNAKIDDTDSHGNSPLWRAVMNSKGETELIELLLKHGANPFQKNNHDNSAYDVAKNCEDGVLLDLFEKFSTFENQE